MGAERTANNSLMTRKKKELFLLVACTALLCWLDPLGMITDPRRIIFSAILYAFPGAVLTIGASKVLFDIGRKNPEKKK